MVLISTWYYLSQSVIYLYFEISLSRQILDSTQHFEKECLSSVNVLGIIPVSYTHLTLPTIYSV